MKSPHNQRPDDEAREDTEKFIAEYARRPGNRRDGQHGGSGGGQRAFGLRSRRGPRRRPRVGRRVASLA